jgi:hypothetical protein
VRGELWRYSFGPRNVTVLVLTEPQLDPRGNRVVCAEIWSDDPHMLGAVAISGHGWLIPTRIATHLVANLTEHVGDANGATMETVKMTLRAMLDL